MAKDSTGQDARRHRQARRHPSAAPRLRHPHAHGGADVRHIQALLGHASLASTERYTHVAITKLQQVHAATHPGAGGHPEGRRLMLGDGAMCAACVELARKPALLRSNAYPAIEPLGASCPNSSDRHAETKFSKIRRDRI